MKESWSIAIGYLLPDEGPELNISAFEPGGASKYGISMVTFAEYRTLVHEPAPTIDDLKILTADDASAIYRMRFADQIGFDRLPAGVDYRMLDISANLGVTGGLNLLRSALGDWHLSPLATLIDLAVSSDPHKLISDLSVGWISIKSQRPNWPQAAHGWLNRNGRAFPRALAMVK